MKKTKKKDEQSSTSLSDLRPRKRDLVKKLDRIFSKYIRLRDSVNGLVKCVTCGQYRPIESMTVGHFIKRQYLGTRFDERNVHPQCRSCNYYKQGNDVSYARWLVGRYGENILDILELESRKHLSAGDIMLLIDIYQDELNKIKQIKQVKNTE